MAEKNKGGRPTKFTPAMCERVIELGKTGASKHEMAMELDINFDTFAVWQKENSMFSDAVRQAMGFSQAWWEKNGRIATFGGCEGFNATSYIFNMKNRFKDDWQDEQKRAISGVMKNEIVVASVREQKAAQKLTDDAEEQDS